MKWTAYLRPSEHRRINEFVGLVLVTVAVLIALSLLSFETTDPSFNISSNGGFEDRPSNLIGVVGSHAADLSLRPPSSSSQPGGSSLGPWPTG